MFGSDRSKRNALLAGAITLTALAICSRLFAQNLPAQGPGDLQLELRSATGSNRFQLGEVIPLEVFISSSTSNRYLEPCVLFRESCFGYPRCRFATGWSFDVIPSTGWTDIGWHGCRMTNGPFYEIKSSDLTTEPKKYSYTLTNRFRFDTPGKYTVRLSITVGLDDETNQIRSSWNPKLKHNSVSKTAEITLEIVPARDEWKKTVIERGVAVWTASPYALPYSTGTSSNPSSPAELKQQQEKEALCYLGTPEAAVALVGLLSRGIDVSPCLRINANKEVAAAEMRRLLVEPDVGVRPMFFAAYAKLLSPGPQKPGDIAPVLPDIVNDVRDRLFASLPNKTPEAMIVSLETVLMNPLNGYWFKQGSVYDLQQPYSNEVIAMAAANFDRLSDQAQAAILDRDWPYLRSPLMLPVVRRKAEAGNGPALLRWLELDPTAATAFMRKEVVRPAPRFSALYLRLPDKSLPEQEQQIAANFVGLSLPFNIPDFRMRSATLLYRYTTKATLPTVLPFIDQHLSGWPCEVQIPVLAYLLKVSPDAARPRVQQVLEKVDPSRCPRGFFPSLGYMQASPVLDNLAAKQLEDGTPLAADAAEYLGSYGSAAMKSLVWEQLARWHTKYMESGAEERMKLSMSTLGESKSTPEDWQLSNLDSRLLGAYVSAQGWLLSPADIDSLSKLIGHKNTVAIDCTFGCDTSAGIGLAPGSYLIRGRVTDPVFSSENRVDYLMPTEPFQYSVKQYQCPTLKSLEQKLLQFPKGSTFAFAQTSSLDQGDWTTISAFLRRHGYSVRD